MRSRPSLEIAYWPQRPRAGERIQFEARLKSPSDTPVDGVFFRFTGREERLSHTEEEYRRTLQHTWFDLYAEADPTTLTVGEELVLPFHFDLPEQLPPSYRSPVSKVEYRLDVRVDIPWWPDRTAHYTIRIWPALKAPAPTAAAFLATRPRGPQGKEVHLELTVDRAGLELGGQLAGAVSVENTQYHSVRRLELAVVVVDAPVGNSACGPREVYRSDPIVLEEKAPKDGVAYPFRLRLPEDVVPSFLSHRICVRWFLEARAVVRFGTDVVLRSQLEVAQPFEGGEPVRASVKKAKAPRTAPLGRERRALVWAAVARMTGLTSDPDGETMSGTIGELALTVMLELRGAQLYSVAMLAWPSLRLELELAERRWRDALSASVPVGDEPFDKRFTVRARAQAQVQALLTPEVRAQLSQFERVALDDEGADLVSFGNGYTIEALEPFVHGAVATAAALSAAFAQVPAPPQLVEHQAAWQALAQQLGGRFQAGSFSIHQAQYRQAPVELLTRFDAAGLPEATVARVRLDGPKAPNPEALQVMTRLASECTGLRLADDAVEATLPCPLPDPERAQSLWRALTRVVEALGQQGAE